MTRSPAGPISRLRTTLRLAAAALVLVAQVGLLAADIAEGSRGEGSAAHVETRGTARHYAHNEATCVVCVARTLHASPSQRAALAAADTPLGGRVESPVVRPAARDRHSSRLSRAPPSMI